MGAPPLAFQLFIYESPITWYHYLAIRTRDVKILLIVDFIQVPLSLLITPI